MFFNNTIELVVESDYPQDIKISKIIRHPCYKPPKKYYDIALIELERSLDFNKNVQPACLWNSLNTDKIEKASAAGWGVTEVGKWSYLTNFDPKIIYVFEITIYHSFK